MSTTLQAKRQYKYTPNYAVKPSETLCEVIEGLGMTQQELAIRAGLTEQTVVHIMQGEQPITFEMANKLELATGVPSRLWNKLETQYRERHNEIVAIDNFSTFATR